MKHKRFLAGLWILLSCMLIAAPVVGAAEAGTEAQSTQASTENSDSSKAPVTQSYGTTAAVQKGMIVRLNAKDENKVDPLRQDQSADMFGVVVAANAAALSLTNDLSKSQVYVATYGKYDVLVSTQNGVIKKGDYIGISTLAGVGMKADDQGKTVIGKALAAFDGKSEVQGTASLKDQNGKTIEVSLGRLPVEVAVQSNPLQSVALPTAFTDFLSRVGYTVSNKTISPGRLYLALIMLLIVSFISGGLIFSAVRSTMVAIGRNPLAKRAIYRSLIQVVIVGLTVFILGIFAVYLLLKL